MAAPRKALGLRQYIRVLESEDPELNRRFQAWLAAQPRLLPTASKEEVQGWLAHVGEGMFGRLGLAPLFGAFDGADMHGLSYEDIRALMAQLHTRGHAPTCPRECSQCEDGLEAFAESMHLLVNPTADEEREGKEDAYHYLLSKPAPLARPAGLIVSAIEAAAQSLADLSHCGAANDSDPSKKER
mmetsp:Transcript_14383/g.50013  ORF Transcript_14383/g.50013 Transcript_14383/m.50013 type:complete len:185 (-) Transcript_14383:186-740(-)